MEYTVFLSAYEIDDLNSSFEGSGHMCEQIEADSEEDLLRKVMRKHGL
jgi:hypothetical protein